MFIIVFGEETLSKTSLNWPAEVHEQNYFCQKRRMFGTLFIDIIRVVPHRFITYRQCVN
jgi:hypothetical protein